MAAFSVRPVAYVLLPTPSLAAPEHFCSRLLGLETVRRDQDVVSYRTDERAQSIVFSVSNPTPSIGIELNDRAGLERIAELLSAKRIDWSGLDREACSRRKVRDGIATADPSGNRVELVTGAQVSGRRFYAGRDSGVNALSAVGMRSRAIEADVAFWTGLGAEIGDRVGDITYLRMDDAHHRIALYPSSSNGILYVSLALQSHDHLMQNSYFFTEHQIRIVHGPGRETASGRMFVRLVGPNDQLFSLEYDEQMPRPDGPPRQFELSVDALCSWGSRCDSIDELTAPAGLR